MLLMEWRTNNGGRLVAGWKLSREVEKTPLLTCVTQNAGVGGTNQNARIMFKSSTLDIRRGILFESLLQIGRWLRSPCGRLLALGVLTCIPLTAQDGGLSPASVKHQNWDVHFQSTVIGQGALPFQAEYSGPNSLEPHGEIKDTFSFDVIGHIRAWRGGELLVDVLSWQGYGLSKTEGIAGFPNGEAYRVGKTFPDAIISRAYLRETVSFGGKGDPADPKAVSGGSKSDPRLILTVGHIPAVDVFDKNAYANDPRTQFMNWGLVNNAAWDYPANSLGFTNGASAELEVGSWTARAGIFQVSRVANAMRMDWSLPHAWSLAGELENRHSILGRPGALRLLAYKTRAHMGNYQESIGNPQNIAASGQLGYHIKYGFGINLEQEVKKDLGAFARVGWNDGKNQTWEFTDVDRTASAGLNLKGGAWRRPRDTLGFGAVVNGISAVHRQFLANGGLGITVGDGRVNYDKEEILETYYSIATRWGVSISPDFQYAAHPAYNRDRGPAPIYALRFHWER